MHLPDNLRLAIEAELQTRSPKDLAAAVRGLSERYRTHHARMTGHFLQSEEDVTAYLVYRLPATFTAISAVLREVRDRKPDLEPRSLLDIGAGPGTAAWAAAEVWPSLHRVTMMENDARMIRVGTRLVAHSRAAAVRDSTWVQGDVSAPRKDEPADITIAAYLVGELRTDVRGEFIRRLWDCTAGDCIIVEPGTPRGFDLIREATVALASAGAYIVAPFPHDWQCTEGPEDWCHFSERVPRTRLHRSTKDATLSYEDEKYAYVAASRIPGQPIAARVIRHPQVRSGHVRLVLCSAQGVKHTVVTRSDREAYRKAKALSWGSAIPLEDAELFDLPT
jgi:ribosomal protein RSM22 (predicted rRNA methylase)